LDGAQAHDVSTLVAIPQPASTLRPAHRNDANPSLEMRLWGRESLMATLGTAAHQAELASSRIVIVEATAGLGKSTLLESCAIMLAEQGRFVCLRASCCADAGVEVAIRQTLERFLGTERAAR